MSRQRTRPTREETRRRLFDAAAAVFVRDGIAGASIADICTEAGLTRGALYSNFADKNELVMAMIDDHVDRNMAELARLDERASSPVEFIALIESSERRRDGPLEIDPVLQMEFTLHALRNPVNRPRLAEHQRRWREVIEAVVRADCERLGVEPPIPANDAAAMILAMDNGYLLAEMIEPGSYRPGTFSRNVLMLQQLFEVATRTTAPEDNR
ncbi:MAG: TetR/AcrR family transcriptional regulator [Acidimicrobiales bacterium]